MTSIELIALASLAVGIVAIFIAIYFYYRLKREYETLKEALDGYGDIIARRIYEKEVTAALSNTVISTNQQEEKPMRLTNTEIEILKLCQAPSTAKEIQQKMGLTREHITRELKKLYEMKLIERANQDKPFKYIISEKGKEAIKVSN